MKLKDLSGRLYGRWKVLGRSARKSSRICWDCVCECGTTRAVFGNNLVLQNSLSCRNCSRKLPDTEMPFRSVFRWYRQNAKRRTNRPFVLSLEDVRKLTSSDCFYCGSPPSQESKHRMRDGKVSARPPYVYNGIDRVNNSLGYTPENCVSCCKICNYMKQELSQQEFINHIKEILERWRS